MTREQHYYIVGVLTLNKVKTSEKIRALEKEHNWHSANYYKQELTNLNEIIDELVAEWDLVATAC